MKPKRDQSKAGAAAASARYRAKQERIDLGLAISAATMTRGQWRSAKQIAAFCDTSHQAIEQIEARAIAKIRPVLHALALAQGILHSPED